MFRRMNRDSLFSEAESAAHIVTFTMNKADGINTSTEQGEATPRRIIDVSSRKRDCPEFDQLSNLADRPFVMDGIHFLSLEGFLQCIKTNDSEIQMSFCKMTGKQAKRAGRTLEWQQHQTLYWKGKAYGRHTEEYQQLISRAFQESYHQSEEFRTLLAATGDAVLIHSIGKQDPTQTILTESEFVNRLLFLREYGKQRCSGNFWQRLCRKISDFFSK